MSRRVELHSLIGFALVVALTACDAGEESGVDASTRDAASVDAQAEDGGPATDAATSDAAISDGAISADGATPDGSSPPGARCASLPPPSGDVISVGPADDLAAAIASAPAGATVSLAAGTYEIAAAGLWVGADGVTVRGASGARGDVILDGGYRQTSGGLINVRGRRDVTIAHLTIRRARYHSVHVTGGPDGPSTGARLYDLHLADPGEQAVKINSNNGHDCDEGEVLCSLIELGAEGRAQVMSYTSSGSQCYTGGVDAHRARGWRVADNEIRGFWCSNGDLSQHAVHFWRGSRDTLVERNLIVDNARGVGFGLGRPGPGRTFDDDPCPGIDQAEHYGGVIRNNVILGLAAPLFASPNGMDLGIGLESACDAVVAHNTVASVQAPFSSIEWRFVETTSQIVNNLVTHNLRPRNDGDASLLGNVEGAEASIFVDLEGQDARLAASADLPAGHAEGASHAPTDFEGRARDDTPDVGAYER